ncbi:MAG: hypothetical protein A2X77_04560 [Gammaproteobacteria bacterium GWE2_42_36]|nr:MAG: hypothetical protein A2X77_04560 [Gammaproteobacteria bacterium GWE2_42_36]
MREIRTSGSEEGLVRVTWRVYSTNIDTRIFRCKIPQMITNANSSHKIHTPQRPFVALKYIPIFIEIRDFRKFYRHKLRTIIYEAESKNKIEKTDLTNLQKKIALSREISLT